MDREPRRQRQDREGYALMTVTIFAFILVLAGLAFFAMTSYETNQARYRQESSQAFYLADGAIERARARLLMDRMWRAGFPDTTTGDGTYSLVVRDTTFGGYPDVIWLQATGTLDQAVRRIEAFASVPATASELPLLVCGEADVLGNLDVVGNVHVNDPGFDPKHVNGSCTAGFPIYPPEIRTEPSFYPGCTYYDVQGISVGAGEYGAVVFEHFSGAAVCTLSAANGVQVWYNSGQKVLSIDFQNVLADHFYGATPSFPLLPGDQHVVVNFSGPHYALDANSMTDLTLNDDVVTSLQATVINARYEGPLGWSPDPNLPPNDPANLNPRLQAENWQGGTTYIKQITLEPTQGIGLIAHDFQWVGGAGVAAGTDANPCLIYVTGDVSWVNANFELIGSLICLGDWKSTGGPSLTYDPDFLERLPDFLYDAWLPGVSGTLRILRWQEVAAN